MSNQNLEFSWADEAGDEDIDQETPISAPQHPESTASESADSTSPQRQNSSFAQDDNKLTLFVNNIPFEASNEALRRFFEDNGCQVVRAWVSGKGNGNVVFENFQSVQTALSLQDMDFNGRNINIKPARPRNHDNRRGDQDRNNRDRRNNSGRGEPRGDNFRRPFDRRNDDPNRPRNNNTDRRNENREERGRDNRGPGGPRRGQDAHSPTHQDAQLPSETQTEVKERPKLQLLPRTVGETPGQSVAGTKSNPFGEARPREVVLEERKKLQGSLSNSSENQDAPKSPTPPTQADPVNPPEQTNQPPQTPTQSSEQSQQTLDSTPTPVGVDTPVSDTTSSDQSSAQQPTEADPQAKHKPKPKPKPKGKQASQQTGSQQKQKQNTPKAKPKQNIPTGKPGDKKKASQNIFAYLGETNS